MTEEEWFEFVTFGRPPVVSVGRLETTLCAAVGSATSLIQMRHDYDLKALAKHKILPQHFRVISWTLDHGIVFQDSPKHLTFFWSDKWAGWFQVTIKCSKLGTELWIATFHRQTRSKIEAKLRHAKILRSLIS